MAARRGRRVDPELWARLGLKEAERRPEPPRAGLLQRALGSRVGRAAISSLPTAALAAIAAALIIAGNASVAGPIRIVGIIAFATLSGVLPPILVLAARRRSGVAASASRVLAGTALMAITGVVAIVVLVLHATVLWSDPAERGLAAVAAAFALASVVMAARHGAFRPAALLDMRQGEDSEAVRIRAQESGRDLDLEIGDRAADADAEYPLQADTAPLTIHGRFSSAAELRVSAHRLDQSGGSAALPVAIELRDARAGGSLRMKEIGGIATLAVKPGDWTVVVRPEDAGPPEGVSSPLDRL